VLKTPKIAILTPQNDPKTVKNPPKEHPHPPPGSRNSVDEQDIRAALAAVDRGNTAVHGVAYRVLIGNFEVLLGILIRF
jgi:hypothetical protein